jgi:hypothetical protein
LDWIRDSILDWLQGFSFLAHLGNPAERITHLLRINGVKEITEDPSG